MGQDRVYPYTRLRPGPLQVEKTNLEGIR